MSHRLLVKDSVGERELLLIDRILVGRDPRCDISDSDAQLSRRHVEFSVSDRGVLVRDLNSRNGMLVNGRKVLEAILHPGDVVQVASLAVTFVTATAEPEAVSMPSPAAGAGRRAAAAPLRARRPNSDQAVLPFRRGPDDDDRTKLMTADQVAAAAVASLAPREAPGVGAVEGADVESGTVGARGDGGREALAPRLAPQYAGEVARQAVEDEPGWPPPPSLAPRAAVPITGRADSGWTARLTWHVATLAIVAFLIGTVSALPWRMAPLGGAAVTALAVLFVPLVALLAALGLGIAVAARLRRGTLSALSALTVQVEQARAGEIDRVLDPLGTKPTAELAAAINEVLLRARRP